MRIADASLVLRLMNTKENHKVKLPEVPFYEGFQGPLPVVHRGGDGAGLEKENSLAAFQSAWEAGITYAETDTVSTSDGVALAIHGSAHRWQAKRTGLPVRSSVEAMTLDEVKRNVRVSGEPVPTLEEVLITFPKMRFFIDPKTRKSVQPLANLINKLNLHDRISVGAFNFGRTQSVAEAVSKKASVCTSIGTTGSLALMAGKISWPLAKHYVRRVGATQFALPFNYVTAAMVDRAHDLGMRVMLWTPNTADDIKKAFDTGADGVMSDRTTLVKSIAETYTIGA